MVDQECCKNCGQPIPVVVREVEKKVEIEVGDGAVLLRIIRWLALVSLAGIVFGASSCLGLRHFENRETEKILSDPNVKIEIRERPGIQPERIYTRDPAK